MLEALQNGDYVLTAPSDPALLNTGTLSKGGGTQIEAGGTAATATAEALGCSTSTSRGRRFRERSSCYIATI